MQRDVDPNEFPRHGHQPEDDEADPSGTPPRHGHRPGDHDYDHRRVTLPPLRDSRDTRSDGQATDESDGQATNSTLRRPRLSKRGLSRTMTEWKRICDTKKLPETTGQPVDYVIVYHYENKSDEAETENYAIDPKGCCGRRKKVQVSMVEALQKRKRFRRQLKREGIEVVAEHKNEEKHLVYMLLHTPFWRLCAEAERVCLKMPLKNCQVYDDVSNCCIEAIKRHLETDEEEDYVSGPFLLDRFPIYKDSDNADKFFRPAVRSLLTHMILINIGDPRRQDKELTDNNESQNYLDKSPNETSKQGLLYMLHNKYFTDAFTMHDPSSNDPGRNAMLKMHFGRNGGDGKLVHSTSSTAALFPVDIAGATDDTRQDLDRTWARSCRFQPLWRVRNYFGEKVALYFAWCGTLIITLWIPMLLGLAVFIYGLYLSVSKRATRTSSTWTNTTTSGSAAAMSYVEESISIVKESFDNDITPYYALMLTIWGTVFLELWKRTNNTLSYEWDVDSFENSEPDRPEFVGNKTVKDPVTGLLVEETTFGHKCIRFSVSIGTLLFMVCLVFIIVAAVIVYRVVLTVDYCASLTPTGCLLAATVGSSLLNAGAIVMLGKIYDYLAVKLTNWENHRTQTEYNDALIMKMFAFQFANSYTSLFYIAFFRGRAFQNGLFGLGEQYKDTCGEVGTSCMSMLSFQVLTLMLTKPIPKFLTDVVIPIAKYLWHTKIKKFFDRCKCNKVGDETSPGKDLQVPSVWEMEQAKPDTGDFTLMEYTEKVIIYGFVMLFAVSLSLAPLIAMVILVIDIRVDAKRMLWLNRRPIAFLAQDIGMWYTILEFMNIIGVITNACLIAFTSSWGQQYDLVHQLLIVIGFEHIVFAIKFILAALIPDVPEDIKLAMRRETFQNQRIREDEKCAGIFSNMDTAAEENEMPAKSGHRKSRRTRDNQSSAAEDGDENAVSNNKSRREKLSSRDE